MSDLPVAVNISDLGAPGWDWIGERFAEDPFRWLSFTARSSSWLENRVSRPKIGRYRACWQGIAAARRERAKVIVTHEALVAAWASAFYQANQLDAPHLAFAFTFSKLPTGARRRAFKRAVRSVDRFVCFSSVERARYADYFDIPIEKIDTLRWSVAEPDFDASEAPIESGEYLCAVGSEGRDYATLIEAMRRLPELKLVLVARPENLVGLEIPANVSVHQNIPLQSVWNIVAHAKVMVLPLRDTEVPCGHSTLIMAMQFRTPSIVTESEGMTDYIEPGRTGLVCPTRDPAGMAETIERLYEDDTLAASLADRGRTFAIEECSEERTVAYFTEYLRSHGLL